jgi:hypothetical protein
MAIIVRGLTKYPLCAKIIADEQSIVSTSHFIESPAHPLWPFPMRQCITTASNSGICGRSSLPSTTIRSVA